jgi:hypothetical protein
MGGICGAYRVGHVAGQAAQGGTLDGSNFCSALFQHNAPQQACMRGFDNAGNGMSTFDLTNLSCPMREQPEQPVDVQPIEPGPGEPGNMMRYMRR